MGSKHQRPDDVGGPPGNPTKKSKKVGESSPNHPPEFSEATGVANGLDTRSESADGWVEKGPDGYNHDAAVSDSPSFEVLSIWKPKGKRISPRLLS